jgi:hypothetical protein
MPIIYIEGVKTTLLTLFGCTLGFIGGKGDTALNNTRFMTSPSEFTNFHIQLPLISLFKFVRSRCDPKEKIAGTGPDMEYYKKTFPNCTTLNWVIMG